MEEVWKPVKEFEEIYEVSNAGRVRRVGYYTKNGKFIPAHIVKDKGCNGYRYITLTKDGLQYSRSIHRLVGFAFVNGYFEGAEIDHINAIRDDNRCENLRWTDRKGNMANPITKDRTDKVRPVMPGEKNPMYGRHHTEEAKEKCRAPNIGTKNHGARKVNQYDKDGTFVESYGCVEYAAESVGIPASNISRCCRGKCRSAAGYIWEYAEGVMQ